MAALGQKLYNTLPADRITLMFFHTDHYSKQLSLNSPTFSLKPWKKGNKIS